MRSIPFTKMHGLGNDFVIINSLQDSYNLNPLSLSVLSNRHTGIGFDQLLIIEKGKKADFFCRIYNADGSEAEQCGNGLRCIARYLHEEKILDKKNFQIETRAGIYSVEISDYDSIKICMGKPRIINSLIELTADNLPTSILSMGNPHAILKTDSLENNSLQILAEKISSDAHFPEGVNVGFMQIINPHNIKLRTFERGAGETYSCGSNACAAAAAGISLGWLQPSVKVDFARGSLLIDWEGEDKPLYMTGSATKVYSGNLPVNY